MSELEQHVEPPGRGWLRSRIAGLACLIAGVGSLVAMLVLSAVRGRLEMLPPLAYTLAPLGIASALAIWAVAREERSWRLWLPGVGAAAAAVVSGWVVVIGAVVLAVAFLFWLVSELAG